MFKNSNKFQTKRSKKIRKGDIVLAICGNDKGQTGTVVSVNQNKAIVQGFNVKKKHVKAKGENQPGGIIEIEKPIDLSNLMVCDSTNTPVKLKCRTNANNEKELYYKKDQEDVTYRSMKKS